MQIPEKTMAEWSFLHRAIYRFFPILLIPRILGMYFHFEVQNKKYLSNFPEGTPVIYCINHRSHLDGFIAASAVVIPRGPRTRVALMGSGNIMQENWLFRLIPHLGGFPIYPENSEVALGYAVKLLKKGVSIIIAPQGKRIIKTPYHDLLDLASEGKTGVGRVILSVNGKIPVIPAYIHGSAEALSRGKLIPKYGSYISISFGPPIFWHKYTRKNGWKNTDPDFFSAAREITDKIMIKIRDQLILQEKTLFTILERIFGTSIDRITIPHTKKRIFDKLVFKLVRIHPNKLRNFINSNLNSD